MLGDLRIVEIGEGMAVQVAEALDMSVYELTGIHPISDF